MASLGGSYTVRPCGRNHSSVATPPYSRRRNRKPPHAGCRGKKSAALPRSACDDFETVRIAEVYDISSVFVMFSESRRLGCVRRAPVAQAYTFQ